MTQTLAEILAGLPRHVVPDRMAALRGVVRFETAGARGRVTETAALRFDSGTVTEVEDRPDVTIRGTAEVLAAIVSGECNAGLEYLRGTLDIEGDSEVALAVGGIFAVPGSRGVAVDPRDLDPVEVASAVGKVTGDHLKKVMRSGFRGVVLGEIFGRLPEFVNPRRAARVRLTVAFRLTGNPSGEVERYLVSVDHGSTTVTSGDHDARDRDATVTCEAHDFLKLATGHLNPVFGVLRGHLKVKGDQAKALQLSSVIDIPSA